MSLHTTASRVLLIPQYISERNTLPSHSSRLCELRIELSQLCRFQIGSPISAYKSKVLVKIGLIPVTPDNFMTYTSHNEENKPCVEDRQCGLLATKKSAA